MVGESSAFQCCFCGETVAATGAEPVALLVPLSDGGAQELQCHLACFQRVLHPSVPLAVFGDDEAADAEPRAVADRGDM